MELLATAADVANWMVDQFEEQDFLYQEAVVLQIKQRFGDKFVYVNENGNLAISRDVLTEFKKRTESFVIWERGERYWRKRHPGDPEGRQTE